jgi:hypothetical protein
VVVGLRSALPRLVIGKQNGPTSASKMDPPGFRGSLPSAGLLNLPEGIALVLSERGCYLSGAG